MALKFPGAWRFSPPTDAEFINAAMPQEAVSEFHVLIGKVATQGDKKALFEHFKQHFAAATGSSTA